MYIDPNSCITRFRDKDEEYLSEHIICCTDEDCIKFAKKDIAGDHGLSVKGLEEVNTYYQGDESVTCDYCGAEIGGSEE